MRAPLPLRRAPPPPRRASWPCRLLGALAAALACRSPCSSHWGTFARRPQTRSLLPQPQRRLPTWARTAPPARVDSGAVTQSLGFSSSRRLLSGASSDITSDPWPSAQEPSPVAFSVPCSVVFLFPSSPRSHLNGRFKDFFREFHLLAASLQIVGHTLLLHVSSNLVLIFLFFTPAVPGLPRQSPVQVLTRPEPVRSGGIGFVQGGAAVH